MKRNDFSWPANICHMDRSINRVQSNLSAARHLAVPKQVDTRNSPVPANKRPEILTLHVLPFAFIRNGGDSISLMGSLHPDRRKCWFNMFVPASFSSSLATVIMAFGIVATIKGTEYVGRLKRTARHLRSGCTARPLNEALWQVVAKLSLQVFRLLLLLSQYFSVFCNMIETLPLFVLI